MDPPGRSKSLSDPQPDGFIESDRITTGNTQLTGKEDSQYCSCKKSNCLKLYCDCFASGSFCAEVCRCKDCYNKYEFEEIVSDSKERIQSRMPHAFAPKIIHPVTNTQNISGDSGRHRVGCNCRKSMCIKNYCECFKAHVGCSSACRCEDCKNGYGIKDASGEIVMDGKSETVKVKSEMIKPEQCHTRFQSSIQKTPNFNSYYQASGSHDAENFGSFLPHCYNFAGRTVFSPPSNCEILKTNVSHGRDHLSVNPLPLTDESNNELEPHSNSGLHNNLRHNYEILKDSSSPIEAVKTSSSNQESLSPSNPNIQETRSSLSPR